MLSNKIEENRFDGKGWRWSYWVASSPPLTGPLPSPPFAALVSASTSALKVLKLKS